MRQPRLCPLGAHSTSFISVCFLSYLSSLFALSWLFLPTLLGAPCCSSPSWFILSPPFPDSFFQRLTGTQLSWFLSRSCPCIFPTQLSHYQAKWGMDSPKVTPVVREMEGTPVQLPGGRQAGLEGGSQVWPEVCVCLPRSGMLKENPHFKQDVPNSLANVHQVCIKTPCGCAQQGVKK